MEHNFGVNFVPPELDRGSESSATLESRSESARSNSFESAVTVESSRCCWCESCCDAHTRPDECSGWTDEKHNSYLDYLEKSFVRKLHCLMGGKTHRLFTTHDLPTNPCKSSDQFVRWQKINFGNKRARLDTSSDFSLHENPAANHFSGNSGSYTAVRGGLLCNEKTNHSGDKVLPGTSLKNLVGHECSTEITAEGKNDDDGIVALSAVYDSEGSGQNFTDGEKEERPFQIQNWSAQPTTIRLKLGPERSKTYEVK
ncbi:PREDICTED: uncharacterized protein LOC104807270 isoform X2 [Tarenaya hassleriana]|uniref:uncharacterized protein LOC104807270 isoform X2 n=1 Tax=Tarenaya hassleriana TaxID=28532 RepID=UPI00053C8036|nr:PREDICTED: uncharacterized protein LOC104807270 isoform X2 [Tarenaya hassleriana]